MAKTITIMTGSVRPNSVGDKLLPIIERIAKEQGVTVQIAKLRELQLPFFDSVEIPSSDSYEITHENVRQWQSFVASSDGMVMVTPEYNYQMSAAQKNAIDWLYKEWEDKPVAIVSYGWGGGAKAATPLVALLEKLKAKPLSRATQLYFTKQLAPDGSILDSEAVESSVAATIDELVKNIS
jgi:NAD(P)H-dependent FMN reductase